MTYIMVDHGNVRHWKIYRILKKKHPNFSYRELRLLSTVFCEFDLNPESNIDMERAIKYLDTQGA